MFRRDVCPHADVGVKQDLLHMLLLSYNPVWLKLGLEVCVCVCVCARESALLSYNPMWLKLGLEVCGLCGGGGGGGGGCVTKVK